MNHQKTPIASCVTVILVLVLSGCSSGPSSSDIEKAIKASNEQSEGLIKIFAINKLGCSQEKDGIGYNCDVELDASSFGVRSKATAQFRFVKGSDGWAVTR